MRIGIIGAGNIGHALAVRFAAAGHQVMLSNSRGPATLADLVASVPGDVRAGTVAQAADFGEVVAVAIPLRAIRDLPPEPFAGKLAIDANNYYPQRDGHIPELDADQTTSSELLASLLPGATVVKAFNRVYFQRLLDDSHPERPAAQRLAVPVAGDNEDAKRTVIDLIDQIGFTGVDAGTLAESRRLQPVAAEHGRRRGQRAAPVVRLGGDHDDIRPGGYAWGIGNPLEKPPARELSHDGTPRDPSGRHTVLGSDRVGHPVSRGPEHPKARGGEPVVSSTGDSFMHTAGRATLAVLGAGPKGIAIAAKRAALARTGWKVPDLLLIDREGVAANWSGAAGYTDGRQRLSTAPEKDVGFPYAHTWGADSERISHQMNRWSWQSYLVHDDGFADWVDRGRPRPTHRQWSQYLRWVAARIPVEPLLAEVDRIDLAGGRWRLTARTPTGERLDVDCDGLVLTGPGPPLRLPGQPDDHPRILDGRSFWTSQDALGRGGPVEVCVIGNGETAGSIAAALLGVLPEGSTIELVSDHGVLYTRGESFTENRFYSDPSAAGWQRLAERHRREFVRRTDRGVFSVQVENVLNRAESVRTVAGRVTRLEPVEGKVVVEVDYEQQRERIAFDWVVVAAGFDALWFWHLLGERARAALAALSSGPAGRLPARIMLERAIGHDLAIAGLHPKLHLPVLAGVAQGPGFPNLSCLGLLADRVLGAYTVSMTGVGVPEPDAAARGTTR